MSLTPDQLPRRSANIFINYRREDSAGHAGRLFDRLSSRFPSRVFMDVDTIGPGIDFIEVIEQAVGCCEVLIVMIGPEWLETRGADGRRRLDNPSDFVRLEIAAALERKIRVIPVLVNGAIMPRPDDLPPDLVSLTRRNAIELSDARFAFDVDRLIQAIEGVLQEKAPSALLPAYKIPAPPPSPAPRKRAPVRKRARRRAATALFAAGLLAGAGWLGWHFDIFPRSWNIARISTAPARPPSPEPSPPPPAARKAAERENREPAVRIAPRTVRPPKEAIPRKEEPGKMRRLFESAKRKLFDRPASGPEQR
jgi:hypothetical protein